MIKLTNLITENKSLMNLARFIDNMLRAYKNGAYKDNTELNDIMKNMDSNNVNSKFLFSVDSLFPRNSFKIDYIRSGKAQQMANRLYIEPTEPLKKIGILKDFILHMDGMANRKDWYSK